MKKSITIIFGVMTLIFGLLFTSSKIQASEIVDNIHYYYAETSNDIYNEIKVNAPDLENPKNYKDFLMMFLSTYGAPNAIAIISIDTVEIDYDHPNLEEYYDGWIDTIIIEKLPYNGMEYPYTVKTSFYYKGNNVFTYYFYGNDIQYIKMAYTTTLLDNNIVTSYNEGYEAGQSYGYSQGYQVGYNEGSLVGSENPDAGDNGAYIAGYPPSISSYYKLDLFSDYFYMTTGEITVDQEMKVIIIYVPNFDFIVTSGGTGTEQNVTFYDVNNNVILRVPVFGRLFGWFTYNIPEGTVKVEHQVLNKGSVPANYVNEWNKQVYISYGDNLEVYQSAWNEGYNDGKSDGINIGRIEGYNDGYNEGIHEGRIDGYNDGVSTVYYDGFGGIINPDTNLPYDVTASFPYNTGYNAAQQPNNDFSFTGILFQVFAGLGALLTIELLPNITIGAIVAVPLVFGIIYFILGKRSGE